MRTRFGPAGRPINYKGPTENIPEYLRTEEGLDAFEYQAVRGVKISKDKAQILGESAKKFDVLLSLHAPYAINLASSSESTRKASVERLIRSLEAAKWMGARIVVFHPGYYGKFSKEEALKLCIKMLKDARERADSLGFKEVFLGPETMGKLSQVGSLDEIITMCESVPKTLPVIDWAHIHARTKGGLKSKDDYLKVLSTIEDRLGSDVVKTLHCHFTKVEFSDKGERRHRRLDEEGFGPHFEQLATIIVENGYSFTIISESPVLDKDAIVMKRILEQILRTKQQT